MLCGHTPHGSEDAVVAAVLCAQRVLFVEPRRLAAQEHEADQAACRKLAMYKYRTRRRGTRVDPPKFPCGYYNSQLVCLTTLVCDDHDATLPRLALQVVQQCCLDLPD